MSCTMREEILGNPMSIGEIRDQVCSICTAAAGRQHKEAMTVTRQKGDQLARVHT